MGVFAAVSRHGSHGDQGRGGLAVDKGRGSTAATGGTVGVAGKGACEAFAYEESPVLFVALGGESFLSRAC